MRGDKYNISDRVNMLVENPCRTIHKNDWKWRLARQLKI